jgi:3-hydroxy-9,10-secoandrosta-1,3,5(10)-triene-9,17-dione monooxygenase
MERYVTADERLQPLLATVREIAPVLRANADRADVESKLSDESAKALLDAGLFRLAVPKSLGGYEVDLTTLIEIAAELGQSCPSSAWVVTITYGAQHMAASFGERTRRELWGDAPDGAFCGSFGGVDVVTEKVAGGQLVSGRWPWASGAYQARWAVVGLPIFDEDGVVTSQGLAVIPADDLSVRDTWDMAGMRGIGSHTLVADEVVVPDHRIRSFAQVLGGPAEGIESIYRVPIASVGLTLLGPMLGAAQAVLDLTMETVRKGKPMAGSVYAHLADSPSMQANLADATNLLDSAGLHVFRSTEYLDTTAAAGGQFDTLGRARVRMDAGYASKCLRDALHLLLSQG